MFFQYNITIEVLGRPRIPFSSIYTEFILLGTIIASFGLVLPRIALAGRLWLVSKPQKTFLGRPDVPHIVLIIDDNDDRYGGFVELEFVSSKYTLQDKKCYRLTQLQLLPT